MVCSLTRKTLGESFVPGDDSKHFCKPTDLADGYCNARIVKFDAKGNFVNECSPPENEQSLAVAHSIILMETLGLVCVADRENGLIVCFDDENDGQVKVILDHALMKSVYAINYDANKHRLYAVSGKHGKTPALGFTFSAYPDTFGELIAYWKPNEGFGEPHDLALSVNGHSLFVGEIRPNRIDSFDVLN